MHVSEVDRELGGERARRQLREGKPLLVVGIGNPLPRIDEIPVHIAGKRYRTAKSQGAQPQEVHHQLP
ncbi:hypothetical protein D3C87_1395380 [compost metagenome]